MSTVSEIAAHLRKQGEIPMFEMADNAAVGTAGTENGGGSTAAAAQSARQGTPSTAPNTAPNTAPTTPGTAPGTAKDTGAAAPSASGLPGFTDGQAPGAGQKPGEPAKPAEPAKTTPKEVSEAINKATERYQKQLNFYKQRDEKITKTLQDVGLPADIDVAAAQIVATAQGIPLSEAIAKQTASKDMEILGKADAAEIIENGDIETELRRLADKPIPLRTRRDLICFQKLTEAKVLSDETAELEKIGVDVEKLKKDSSFADFNAKLNPKLPISERYELFKKSQGTQTATPPPSVASKGVTPKKDFYTSDEVDHMNRDEINANLEVITRSMKRW